MYTDLQHLRFRVAGAVLALLLVTSCTEQPSWKSEISLHPGFEIERVAAEPSTRDPVDLAFDEYGRAFVIEMPGYPFPDEQSRIILLEDQDNDGIFDTRTLFADSLTIGTSILPYKQGLLVAAPPDILFIKDTDGDNVADYRETLLSGFASGNSQHNVNGLIYGLDNWIYGANGGNSGDVYWANKPEEIISLGDYDFRFKPESREFEVSYQTAWGFKITFDKWGRYYQTSSVDHISSNALPSRYLRGLPADYTDTWYKISDHEEGGLARIYSIGSQHTRVNHPEQSGYFSAACGITYYGAGKFPEEFEDNIFVCDAVLNLVHRDVIRDDNTSLVASRAGNGVEFLASSDRSFRPVNITVGPDGAMYLLDMQRDIIEHPEWIPEALQAGIDLNAGKDKGRIYRITPKGGLPRWTPPTEYTIEALVHMLGDSNYQMRIMAQRLLVDAPDPGNLPALQAALKQEQNPAVKIHLYWTLHGLGALETPQLAAGLRDEHPRVREQALIIAEESAMPLEEILYEILRLAYDTDARVRQQTALALSTLEPRTINTYYKVISGALLTIVKSMPEDRWVRHGVLAAGKTIPYQMVQGAIADPQLSAGQDCPKLIHSFAHIAGAKGFTYVNMLLKVCADTSRVKNATAANILSGLRRGLESFDGPALRQMAKSAVQLRIPLNAAESRGDAKITAASWGIRELLSMKPSEDRWIVIEQALTSVLDEGLDLQERRARLDLVAFEKFSRREELLFALLSPQTPYELQSDALEQIGQDGGDKAVERIITMWRSLPPRLRQRAGDLLLYFPENQPQLLTALEQGEITLGEMNLHLERRRTLLFSEDVEIKRRAEALFSDAGIVTRREAIENMRPALSLRGNAGNGAKIFQSLCAKCHRVGETGADLGPNLTEINRKSAETLFHEILDPNAAVELRYVSHAVTTVDGEIVSGIIDSESPQGITLLAAELPPRIIARSQIRSLQSSGLSLMPEELENGMDHQMMADLLAFLTGE